MREYNGKYIKIRRVIVRLPDGKSALWEKVVTKDVVMVVPIIDKDTILMIKQYRPVINKWLYELPAGALEKGDSPLTRAKKELREETGYSSRSMRLMFSAYSSPGRITELCHFFVAKGLRSGKQDLERNEIIDLKRIEVNKIMKMIYSNKIEDSHTIAGLLYYLNNSIRKLNDL